MVWSKVRAQAGTILSDILEGRGLLVDGKPGSIVFVCTIVLASLPFLSISIYIAVAAYVLVLLYV